MKKLMYTIVFGLAFLSITPANGAIASTPSSLLTTGDSAALWQTNPVSQSLQPSNEPAMPSPVIKAASTAAEAACKGDAARAKPPVPNRPTQIRNVVWRNTRAICLHQIAHKTNSLQAASQH